MRKQAVDQANVAKHAKPLADILLQARDRGHDKVVPPPPPVVKKRGRKKVKETDIQHECMRWLKRHGYFAWRNNTGTFWVGGRPVSFGLKGSPDIIGILPDGRFLGVECKTSTGRQSSDQKKFQERVEALGGVYILARETGDLEKRL